MARVYEAGQEVGYITKRTGWYEFVAKHNYWATGIAARMAEEAAETEAELVAKLRAAGLEVR